ncbi:TetR/AcrR family transcriptional regulator [Sphingobacterium siyangense]|uniref:TetR family transcriptional regulator n=1 Tax=Sphingobacterium siyangense TaxID=459529 RepID=A0A562MKC0_9SPHI|nr:TetR/AcrR family transcriptional regulator [Sphingobacterium siyangense]TWI20354.1 TetR family transcriptional regulator [Sphingobacterium siyangense]
METKMTKAGRTKQLIIERSAPIFNTKGYSGTSINDIQRATGLSRGSIYANFLTKDEVALAAFDYNFKSISDYYCTKISSIDDSIERLLVFPNVYASYLKFTFLQAGCPILNMATEVDDTHPLLRERVRNALTFCREKIKGEIKRGVDRKEIKSDVNSAEVAVIMISMMEGAIMLAQVTKQLTELNMAMRFLKKIIKELKA